MCYTYDDVYIHLFGVYCSPSPTHIHQGNYLTIKIWECIKTLLVTMFLSSMHSSLLIPPSPFSLLSLNSCSSSSLSPPPQCGLVPSVGYTQPCCDQHQWRRWHSTAQWEHGQVWGLYQILPVSVCKYIRV